MCVKKTGQGGGEGQGGGGCRRTLQGRGEGQGWEGEKNRAGKWRRTGRGVENDRAGRGE